MTDARRPRAPWVRAVTGIAASLAAAALGFGATTVAYVARCGVVFEGWSVPNTVSAEICGNDPVIEGFWIAAVFGPLIGGLVGTTRAVANEDLAGSLTWPLLVGAIAPAAIVLVYAVSGFVPT